MATLDINTAFRHIPVQPSHKAYVVVQGCKGVFYIDHVVPFGIHSGMGLQGAVMDMIVTFLNARHWGPNKKWIDDLANLQFPIARDPGEQVWQYAHSVEDIFALGKRLGILWHQTKWKVHDFTGEYAGFRWDLPNKTVFMLEKKRAKYLARVDMVLSLSAHGAWRMDLKTVQELNGTLSHCTFVYLNGHMYMTGLYTFAASFTSKHVPRYPPRSVISDLRWWCAILDKPSAQWMLNPRGPCQDLDLWVNTSSDWGIGIVMGQGWDAWRWVVPLTVWHTQGCNIGWAKMVAIELLLRRLEELGWENADLLLRSDNEGVIKAFRRGRSRNWQVNLSICRTESLCMAHNIVTQPKYVNTKVNRADPVSRSMPGPMLMRFKSSFALPEELSKFLVHA